MKMNLINKTIAKFKVVLLRAYYSEFQKEYLLVVRRELPKGRQWIVWEAKNNPEIEEAEFSNGIAFDDFGTAIDFFLQKINEWEAFPF